MKKKTKIIIGTIVVIIIAITVWFGCNFAPGSYPYAEQYEVNLDEKSFIEAIRVFKTNNPEYIVPEQTMLIDGRKDDADHWYHIYFYLKDEQKIIYTWVRSDGKNKSTFAFVSVNDGLTLGNWKNINHDFNNNENEKYKRKFEERILKRIL